MSRKLTKPQRRFVENFAKTGNATESARIAKYKNPNTDGPRLVSRDPKTGAYKYPLVIAAIKELQNEITHRRIMSIEERKERLTELAESENEQAAIKALDVLNKMEAVYIQKQEVTHNFQGKSDEEVIEIAIEQLRGLGYTVIPPK